MKIVFFLSIIVGVLLLIPPVQATVPGYLVVDTAGVGGVSIYIEGEYKSTTVEGEPLVIALGAGQYEMIVKKEGYREQRMVVAIKSLESTIIQLEMESVRIKDEDLDDDYDAAILGLQTGSIEIRSLPMSGAEIIINNTSYGTTNKRLSNFPIGLIDTEITLNNVKVSGSFQLTEDKTMILLANYAVSPPHLIEIFSVSFQLSTDIKPYFLEITGDYGRAEIKDWSEPVTLMGSHTIQITDGFDYIDFTQDIRLEQSGIVNINIPDKTIPPRVTSQTTHTVNGINFNMRLAPASTFPTGTDDSGSATVDHDFWVAETQVTYELWYTVRQWALNNGYTFANAGQEGSPGDIGEEPSGRKNEPVTWVNWYDSIVWCNALSEMLGYDQVYTRNGVVMKNATEIDHTDVVAENRNGFRLPTSMEWELPARYNGSDSSQGAIEHPAGSGNFWTPGIYASGATANYNNAAANKATGWYAANSGGKTHNVGQKPSGGNGLGLFDMSGNVNEWCFTQSGSDRVGRGGSWAQRCQPPASWRRLQPHPGLRRRLPRLPLSEDALLIFAFLLFYLLEDFDLVFKFLIT